MAIAFYTPDEVGPKTLSTETCKGKTDSIPVIDFHASFIQSQGNKEPLNVLVHMPAPTSKTVLMGLVFQFVKEVLAAAVYNPDSGYGVDLIDTDHNLSRNRRRTTRNDNQVTESGYLRLSQDVPGPDRNHNETDELNLSRGYQDNVISSRVGNDFTSQSTSTFPCDELSENGSLGLSAREDYARIGRSLRQIADSFQLENNRVNGQRKDVVSRRAVGTFEYYFIQAINIFKFFRAIRNAVIAFKK